MACIPVSIPTQSASMQRQHGPDCTRNTDRCRERRTSATSLVASLCLTLFLLAFSRHVFSQVIPPGEQTGSPVNSSDDQHGVDSVNTEGLGLHIAIPLLTIQERGRTYTVSYVYNSPVYSIQFFLYQQPEPNGATGTWAVEAPGTNGPDNWRLVTPNLWQLADDSAPAALCWVGQRLGVYQGYEYVAHTNYRLIDPSGAQHPLGMAYDQILTSGGVPSTSPRCPVMQTDLTSPTLDGSGANVDLTQNAFWVADGTKYTVNDSSPDQPQVTKVEDRNGNILDISGMGPDMMDRTVLAQISWSQTQEVYQYHDSNGSPQTITINYISVPYQTNDCDLVAGIPSSVDTCVEASGDFRLPQSIVLPNNQEYTFTYNSGGHGELTSMTLPSGAAITYQYQRIRSQAEQRTGSTSWSPAYFHYGAGQRAETVNGVRALWQYSTTQNAGTDYSTTVEDPDGNCVVHDYGPVYDNYGNAEVQTSYQNGCGSGATTLKNVATTYEYNYEASPDGTLNVYFIRPNVVTTTLAGGENSQIQTDYETFTFDGGTLTGSWDDPTEIREYDFGASTPTRITDYTYLDQVGSSTRTAAQYVANHIVDKVVTETVSNSSGPLVKTAYDYDNYGSGISRSGAYDVDTTYGNWGNVTKTTVTDEITGTSYISSYTYEDTGNMLSSTDPRGLTTRYGWTDSWNSSTCALPSGEQGHIYLTALTNPASQSTSYQYNSCSGSLAMMTNPNTGHTTLAYDEMGRTTQITAPDTGVTTFAYQDTVPLQMTETTAIDSATTKAVTTTYDGAFRPIETEATDPQGGGDIVMTQYDLLGRVSAVSNPYRSGDTVYWTSYSYDPLGRKIIQTLPDGSTLQWCYDGVATSTSQSACTTNHTAYTGTWVDSLDESGNRMQDVSDGLGRLRAAVEPDPTSNALSFETDYSYDALGNLLEVNQKGASGDTPVVRTFTYDGFSRLLCASNPENSGATCPSSESSAIPPGVMAYTYDPDNNVQTRKDARGITTSYSYDNLNRVTSKTYSDGTATACFQYDQAAGGKGYLSAEWTQSGSCSSTPPGSAGLTEREIGSYDPMGRILTDEQCLTIGNCGSSSLYSLSYTYDWAGNIRSFTNGLGGSSALTFNTTYNVADRLISVTGSPSAGGSGSTALFTASGYTASGALTNASMGTGTTQPVTLLRNYDPGRLWPTSEQDTAIVGGNQVPVYNWTVNNYATNGNVMGMNDSVMGTWTYTYDHLNRLKSGVPGAGAPSGDSGEYLCFAYDPFGNRTQAGFQSTTCSSTDPATATYNAKNQVTWTTVNQATNGFTYDASGDVLYDGKYYYAWDGEERLSGVQTYPITGGTVVTGYVYDAEGQRVAKTTSGAVTDEYLLGLNGEQLTEVNSSGWTHSNVYAGGHLLATYEGPAGTEQQGYYFHFTDWLGTERVQAYADGDPNVQCISYPFGDGSICQHATEQQFTGKERDPETLNDYFGVRYYLSGAGRFLSPDPSGISAQDASNPQSFNLYSYALNAPLTLVDATGLDSSCPPVVASAASGDDGETDDDPCFQPLPPPMPPEEQCSGADCIPISPMLEADGMAIIASNLNPKCLLAALRDTVASGETPDEPDNGYGTLVRGTVIGAPPQFAYLIGSRNAHIDPSSLAAHPDILVRVSNGLCPQHCSTAFGRYQILHSSAGGMDFSPSSQDNWANRELTTDHSVRDASAGYFSTAMADAGRAWQSMPGSDLGGHQIPLTSAANTFVEAINSEPVCQGR